jgi:hypothetical protein
LLFSPLLRHSHQIAYSQNRYTHILYEFQSCPPKITLYFRGGGGGKTQLTFFMFPTKDCQITFIVISLKTCFTEISILITLCQTLNANTLQSEIYKYVYNHLNTHNLNPTTKEQEMNIIYNIFITPFLFLTQNNNHTQTNLPKQKKSTIKRNKTGKVHIT